MIELKSVNKSFKNKKILQDISFKIEKGEIIGLVGANGSGKSTIIRVLSGLILQDSGEVINKFENTGILLEGSRNLYHFLTVYENIRYFSILNNISEDEIQKFIDKYLKIFKLEDKLNEKVGNLSRGMIQKLSIMILLIQSPDFIIMDEPTLGLDIISTIQIRDIIQKIVEIENKTIFIVSHDMKLLENIVSRIILLKGGKIKFDKKIKDLHIRKSFNYVVYYYGKENGLDNLHCEDNIYKTIIENPEEIVKRLGNRIIKMEQDTKPIETIITESMEN